MRRIVVFLLLVAVAAGCSKEEKRTEIPDKTPSRSVLAAVYAISQLEEINNSAKDRGGDSWTCQVLHVDGMSAQEFKTKLEEFPCRRVHVWMPGEKVWMLTGTSWARKISLAKVMDAFAADTNITMSVAEVFASYAGMREEILPAFERKLEGEVVPEWFVTKEIPEIGWLDVSGIDADILKPTLAEIRSAQVMRRELLRGNMLAAKATDKKGEEAATEVWAKVAIRSPNDSMLLERIDRLNRNAKGFLELNKVLQAMKCYETVVLIRPNDPVAIHNFGMCLKRIGKLDMAEKVLKRAEALASRGEDKR